ncbi:MAG: isoaspartyl peptidase/L-asparaginase [Bacteroidales bacterium]|nr:isoaspartyl peptidase/L-asparaginase [Bacteroidales bacterium]
MKKTLLLLILTLFVFSACSQLGNKSKKTIGKYTLVIHGGAGYIDKNNMPDSIARKYKDKLQQVLDSGTYILKNGGTALDAVTKCITMMENSPLFNAGKGAVFNAEGINEMDASIMDGSNLMAGAVANVHTIKNPILAARAVMEHTPHVLLITKGAEDFAKNQGLEIVDPSYFFTESRWKSYVRVKEQKEQGEKHGTVGAAALDRHGNLAAGTSTGGMTYKMPGRVGDSPIIGAGTYADNASCAVSCTGHGEFFIRDVVAYDIGALMKYNQLSLKEAANYIVLDKLKKQKADGGIIAVDRFGNFALTFNTSGMFRGFATSDGFHGVYIFKDHKE